MEKKNKQNQNQNQKIIKRDKVLGLPDNYLARKNPSMGVALGVTGTSGSSIFSMGTVLWSLTGEAK